MFIIIVVVTHVIQRGLVIRLVDHVRRLPPRAQLRDFVRAHDVRVALELRVQKQNAQVGLTIEKINLLDIGQERRSAGQAEPTLLVGHAILQVKGQARPGV